MQIEFAVLCDYAGHFSNRQFVVVGPALRSITASSRSSAASVSLAATVRLNLEDTDQHTFRVDATSPGKRRFTAVPEQPLAVQEENAVAGSASLCNLAVPLGDVFDLPGDYLLHLVIDGQDVKTFPLSVSQSTTATDAVGGPSIAEIDAVRRAEIRDWIDLEMATPSDELLRRISECFSPPAEWFHEVDLFEPEVEPK